MDLKQLLVQLKEIKPADIFEKVKEWDRKTWIYVGAGAVAGILFLIFFFIPAWCQRPVLKKQYGEATTQMLRLKALSGKKPQLESQKKEIQALVDGFQKKLFTEDETAFLLGRISKVAHDAEVELLASKPLENVEPFPAPYSQKYKKYIYQIAIEGSYHRVATFVSLLESYSHYFQIQTLSITPQADKLGKHVADIKLMAVSLNAPSA